MAAPEVERRRKRQREAEQVHRFRMRGYSIAEIARETGLSRTQVSHRLSMTRSTPRGTDRQVRTDVAARLNYVIRVAQERVESGELDSSVLLSPLTVIVDAAMNKARLFGIEAKPVREVSEGNGDAVPEFEEA
ncbi:helix-turn-helix domain-containing protein [Streptomyces virginiae]|uniref:helix-turn-helix domain-containing protein n=1 Tax=Streptomyces virginiae TaxID=1961 RepID=UPI00368CED67